MQFGEEFFVQQKRLAKDTGLSIRTVRREIKELRKKKLLKVIRRNNDRFNWYRLNNEAIRALTFEVEVPEVDSNTDSCRTQSPPEGRRVPGVADRQSANKGTPCPLGGQRVPYVADRESSEGDSVSAQGDRQSARKGTACPLVADSVSLYSNIETNTDKKYKNKDKQKYKEINKDPAFAKSAKADLCIAGRLGFFSMDCSGSNESSYDAEFEHETILLKKQEGIIGHLTDEEIAGSFEYERLHGIPDPKEPRLGRFYPKQDKPTHPVPAKRSGGNCESEKKETGSKNHTENATPKTPLPKSLDYKITETIYYGIPDSAVRSKRDSESKKKEGGRYFF
jgi:DNA-binding Lrp family transcriptional regulator